MDMQDINTSFTFAIFEGFKSHHCPRELIGGLVADIAMRGGKLIEVTGSEKGSMDLPGICMADRPWETIVIDGFKFSVPSQDFECFLGELQRVNVRKFSNGQEYFKIHGWLHCLVLTPEQREIVLQTMYDMLPDVRERSDKAQKEFLERMRRNKHVTSVQDPNAPIVKVSKPPKDNN